MTAERQHYPRFSAQLGRRVQIVVGPDQQPEAAGMVEVVFS
ncbi:hypothetical protein [Comamonas badia]|nr:hypothetical protein [Comamonas badia]